MNSKIVIGILGLVMILAAFSIKPAPETYEIDTQKSFIKWKGYHLAKSYEHNGNISIKSGGLEIENGDLVSGNILIDMTSITNNDLTKEEDNQRLVKDLKSERFFNVAEFPEASLTIKSVVKAGDEYKIDADITIRGITEPLSFTALIKSQGNSFTFHADLEIDRIKHEVMYGWSIENAMLSNKFSLEVELVAEKGH